MWPFGTEPKLPKLKPSKKEELRGWIERFVEHMGPSDGLGTDDRNLHSYLSHYKQPSVLDAYERLIAGLLGKTELMQGKLCLDYGCWYGLTTVMMSLFGLKAVGADINPKSIADAQRMAAFWRLKTVRFTSTAVLEDRSMDRRVDAMFLFDVLSAAHPDEVRRILVGGARLLTPGGYILISDYSNCRNEANMKALRERWHGYEIGAGTPDAPVGHYYKMRVDYLRRSLGTDDENELARLAKGTCYLWGDELINYARKLNANAVSPQAFDPAGNRPAVRAHDGCTFGTALDVVEITSTMRGDGLHADVYPNLAAPAMAQSAEPEYKNTGYFIVARRPKE